MEFSLPASWPLRKLYLLYFRHCLPLLGKLLSGHPHAYRYLNETVESFPYGEDFLQMMVKAGFANTKAVPLTGGIATIYIGDKSGA